LFEHLEPVRQWRIKQLAWFTRIRKKWWKTSKILIFLSPLGFIVLCYRISVFFVQTLYAIIAALITKGIEYYIQNAVDRSREQLIGAGYTSHDHSKSALPITSECIDTDPFSPSVSEPGDAESAVARPLLSGSMFNMTSGSLVSIAETLQQPVIMKSLQYMRALSAASPQPHAAILFLARLWLKFRIYVSKCDSELDRIYLHYAMRMTQHLNALDLQQEKDERLNVATSLTATAVELEPLHGQQRLPTLSLSEPTNSEPVGEMGKATKAASVTEQVVHFDSSDYDRMITNSDGVSEFLHQEASPASSSTPRNGLHDILQRFSWNAAASRNVSRKIIATKLRLRRPREPWTMVWGNLHIPKHEQVVFFSLCPCNFYIIFLTDISTPRRCVVHLVISCGAVRDILHPHLSSGHHIHSAGEPASRSFCCSPHFCFYCAAGPCSLALHQFFCFI
jgi:hypothetical protein